MAKVGTYLNFPERIEEAFKFYKNIFGTAFGGNGILRFGDMPENPGMSLTNEQKKLVVHVELPIMGSHILRGTDAPESMGFKTIFGNNIYINLEPDTRKETKRLYDALGDGGKAIMPLNDMVWGSYFGSCTDKYGVNWMFNCNQPQN